ncbi:MAG TPA: YARHG domain-containing protein [Candidatus Kapabacteria bacterium]|nr:YARHG domain-containing protein [Candidatus Kapabacteria bacterium]
MRQLLFSIFMMLILSSHCRADDSEVFADGATLTPLKNTKVELKKEILTLKYDGKRVLVDVYFEFNNTDKDHTETVGFVTPPSLFGVGSSGDDAIIKPPDIRNFTVVMNSDTLTYTLASFGKSGFRLPKKMAKDIQAWDYLYYFKAHFKNGLNIIHHTYSIGTISNEAFPLLIRYRLTTGKNWANSEMEDFTLNIGMGDDAYFYLPSTFWKDSHTIDWKLSATGRIFPPQTIVTYMNDTIPNTQLVKTQSGIVSFHATHFKPEYDLEFGKHYYETLAPYWGINTTSDSLAANIPLFDFAYYYFSGDRPTDSESVAYLRQATQKAIADFSDSALSLMKNGLFALHDCQFKNQSIASQYKPYPWYMPVDGRTPNVSLLSDSERKLLALIVGEEKRRAKQK